MMKLLFALFLLCAVTHAQEVTQLQIIDTDANKISQTINATGMIKLQRSKLPKNFTIGLLLSSAKNVAFVRSQLLFDGQKDKIREDGSYYQLDDKAAPYFAGPQSAPMKLAKDLYRLNLVVGFKNGVKNSKVVSLAFEGKNTDGLGPLRVFPKADLFPGALSRAGRGGIICRVNTLADNDLPGSLRHCVNLSGPRVVVFEVSGTIKLLSTLTIAQSNITIAGQTAPTPGITLYGNTVRIQASDVLLQHLNIRLGVKSGQKDVMEIFYYSDKDANGVATCNRPGIENIVIDHVNLSWGIDGTFDLQNLSCPGKIKNVTIVDSSIAEHLHNTKASLGKSVHGEGAHSFASLAGHGSYNLGYVRNLFAHNVARNPRIDSNVSANIINNYMYNVGWHGVEVRNASRVGEIPTTINVINNFHGESSTSFASRPTFISVKTRKNFVKNSIYASGNEHPGLLFLNEVPDSKPKNEEPVKDSEIFATSPVLPLDGINIMTASESRDYVIENAGARPADRDPISARLFSDIVKGIGKVLNAPDASEVAWLESNSIKPINTRPFPTVENPDVADAEGWTNLDKVLYEFTKEVSP